MKAFVIAKDDVRAPAKSALLIGPEKDDDKVRREFYAHRAESVHPDGWAVLELHSENGLEAVSVARWKNKEAKSKALAEEAKKIKDEASEIEKRRQETEVKLTSNKQ
jgi:hypothetical protein